jgi:Protein of unknown function (DUF2971)
MNVKEILNRHPPEILYHYTTQTGFLGIVASREIWASHTQYLNDVREFRHAIEVTNEELSAMEREPPLEDKVELLKEMKEGLKGIETINVCVCSFSADGDVLSQWRAYAGRASGFSIGFSGAFLRAVSDELNFWLVPVLYEEGEQRLLVRTLLRDVLEENVQKARARAADHDDEIGQPPGGNLVAYLNRYTPILKHRSFSEEREWRIISRPLFCSHQRFEYRAGASMLIPYFRIPLSSEHTPFSIEELIVGPVPYPEQSIRSVKGLLIKHDLDKTRVRNSEVPYRNW